MKKTAEKIISWIVSGIFVFGAYALAHYGFKAEDGTIMLFALCLIWSDLANYVSKDDATNAAKKP